MRALTSLCCGAREAVERRAVATWVAAGLEAVSFNHPSEIDALRAAHLGDVEYVPITETAHPAFGRHYAPVTKLLAWAAEHAGDEPIVVLNSDIELQMEPADVQRAARLTGPDGLMILARYDYPPGSPALARQTCCGFDVFMMSAKHAKLFAPSFLCLGQAWWDYLLPLTFLDRGMPVYSTTERVALHEEHKGAWAAEWQRCGLEVQRLLGRSFDLGYGGITEFRRIMTQRQLVSITRGVVLPPQPDAPVIPAYVALPVVSHGGGSMGGQGGVMGSMFCAPPSPLPVPVPPASEIDAIMCRIAPLVATMYHATVLELGAYDGVVTERLLGLLPDGPRFFAAFEPDPRNIERCRAASVYQRENVFLIPAAVAAVDGEAELSLSTSTDRGDWSESSTLRAPAPAMEADVPWLQYRDRVSVATRALDSFCAEHGVSDCIDLIWCDIEGAEGMMIDGASQTLAHTRYLVCEAWDKPIYDGALTPAELLARLPGWEMIARLPHDVILRNARLAAREIV